MTKTCQIEHRYICEILMNYQLNVVNGGRSLQLLQHLHKGTNGHMVAAAHVHNILGPCSPQSFAEVHIDRFGAIPKKHQPGCWCLITALSFPEGLKCAIDPALYSQEYTTIDQVAEAAMQLGHGFLLAEVDIKSTYRHKLFQFTLMTETRGFFMPFANRL